MLGINSFVFRGIHTPKSPYEPVSQYMILLGFAGAASAATAVAPELATVRWLVSLVKPVWQWKHLGEGAMSITMQKKVLHMQIQ